MDMPRDSASAWITKVLNDFWCSCCKRVFTSTPSLAQHRQTYNRHRFVFPCCDEPFVWSKSLSPHNCIKSDGGQLSVSDHCEGVDKPDSPDSNAETQDEQEPDKKLSCSGCSATFSRYHNMKAHVLRYPNKHDFSCKQCKKRFMTRQSLERHLCFLVHGRFQCSCLQFFASIKSFKLHVGSDRPYICCACKKRSLTFNNLINHIRSHTKDKPFSCVLCKKTFGVRESLTQHVKLHSGDRPFHCSKCHYSSTTKWNLLLHERIHSKNRDKERRFSCDICGNNFFLKHHLRRHLMVHSEDNGHLCRVCGKLFSQSCYLERHIKKHNRDSEVGHQCPKCDQVLIKVEFYQHHKDTGHFPYVCDPCRKVFVTKFNLERHRKGHSTMKTS